MVIARASRPHRQPGKRSASVRSILSLAGGAAAAVPLAGAPAEAAIIVDSSLSGTVIGWNTGAGQTPSVTTSSLPGGGGFTINTRATANGSGSPTNAGSYFFAGVVAAWAGTGSGVFRRTTGVNQAYLAPFGATVAKGTAAAAFANVNLGYKYSASFFDDGNASFTGPPSKYLLFSFDNSGTTNYGWIELTQSTNGWLNGKSQYSATLGDWAYDDSGATILAGQVPVPEPATAALAMGGALVAGAAGLRRWRKQQAAHKAPAGA